MMRHHILRLLAAVAVSGLLQIAGVLLPLLRTLLGTEPLSAMELTACGVAATVPGLALQVIQRAAARRGHKDQGKP